MAYLSEIILANKSGNQKFKLGILLNGSYNKPMNTNFPALNLPNQFTSLLRADMQVSGQNFSNIGEYIHSQKSLMALVQIVFQDVGKKVNLGSIIKAVGWIGFRDRLTNAYVDYALTGRFPTKPDVYNMTSIIDFEEELKPFTVGGYSRGFLLGFYLKMAQIKLEKAGKEFNPIKSDIIKILKLSKIKIIKVDWLILNLFHFEGFLGREALLADIDNEIGFEKIYNKLSEDQKTTLMGNLLSYGSSVGDEEIFYAKTV